MIGIVVELLLFIVVFFGNDCNFVIGYGVCDYMFE